MIELESKRPKRTLKEAAIQWLYHIFTTLGVKDAVYLMNAQSLYEIAKTNPKTFCLRGCPQPLLFCYIAVVCTI